MSASFFLLEQLSTRGVTVKVTPEGNLRYTPKRLVTAELLAQLKENKTEVVSLLSDKDQGVTGVIGVIRGPKSDTYQELQDDTLDDTLSQGVIQGVTPLPAGAQKALEDADALGLVARWSRAFGYITIHDPTTGEWYDVGYKDAPGWAKREARKRRELRKEDGVTRLLTAAEMEEVWEKEQALMWEQPAVTEKGIVYEDYINEED